MILSRSLGKTLFLLYDIDFTCYSDEDDEEFYLDAEGSVARISHSNDQIIETKGLDEVQPNDVSGKTRKLPK